MDSNKAAGNVWTADDEKQHFPSTIEWWCMEGFFQTISDKKKFSFKTTFTEWYELSPKNIGSLFNLSLFNRETGDHFMEYTRNEKDRLISKPDLFHVEYEDCFLKGKYPLYEMRMFNRKKTIKLHLTYHATSLPYWVAQQATKGHLPMGLGSYRYGFIPNGKLTGTIDVMGDQYDIKGFGYYEHVWGNFSYTNPFKNLSDYKKTLSTYIKLVGRQFLGTKPSFPKTLSLSTENNPLSFDWAWAVLDNGWSVFYGNVLFWIMQGPVMGTLILCKDGKRYEELKNINFRYNKTAFSKSKGFYYPTDLEITAQGKDKTINLRFIMENEAGEYLRWFDDSRLYSGYAIVESPGSVRGMYCTTDSKTKLSGICKIEIQRQISKLGHNMVTFNFKCPPRGFGLDVDVDSHFLSKKMNMSIELFPRPTIGFSIKKNPKP
ncbi:MAG: lipocalin-like domain-containing protein [Thermoplasmatota archaeon]